MIAHFFRILNPYELLLVGGCLVELLARIGLGLLLKVADSHHIVIMCLKLNWD